MAGVLVPSPPLPGDLTPADRALLKQLEAARIAAAVRMAAALGRIDRQQRTPLPLTKPLTPAARRTLTVAGLGIASFFVFR